MYYMCVYVYSMHCDVCVHVELHVMCACVQLHVCGCGHVRMFGSQGSE